MARGVGFEPTLPVDSASADTGLLQYDFVAYISLISGVQACLTE